jgi:hypothetical protein
MSGTVHRRSANRHNRYISLTCSLPGHESYPSRFDVDRETQMLGSVKPYRRQVCFFQALSYVFLKRLQVVISTGKLDWDRDIASTKGSLASYLSTTQSKRGSISSSPNSESRISKAPGIFDAADATRISILNGSHDSISEDCSQDTVLIFPDYVLVSEVPRTLEGAQRLWDGHIDPIVGRSGVPIDSRPNEKKICNTWIIPYSCVILLCQCLLSSCSENATNCAILLRRFPQKKRQQVLNSSCQAWDWCVMSLILHRSILTNISQQRLRNAWSTGAGP